MGRFGVALIWLASTAGYACGASGGAAHLDSGIADAESSADVTTADAGSSLDASARPDTGIIDNCNPVQQTGCDGGASKCVIENVDAGAGASCYATSPNDLTFGAVCKPADCAAGLACVKTSTLATCVKLCDVYGNGAGCESLGNDYECFAVVQGTNWGSCVKLSAACQPVSEVPCTATEACEPILRRTGTWEFRCEPAGTASDGQLCGQSAMGTGCQRGLVCIQSPNMPATCHRYCSMDSQCTPQKCIGTVNNPPFNFCK
jgi:hypothetical protein